jgi:hypothetical protein
MKTTRIVLTLLTLPLLAGFILAGRGNAPAPVQAAPQALPGGLCNRLYLPSVLSGANAGAAAAQPADLIVPPGAHTGNAECAGFPDFNGDGYADLVLGAPRKGNFDTGIVQVVYGSAAGLNAGDGALIDDQVWYRQLGGVAADPDDWYGAAIAMGDFNNDGYDDLAVGIPGATIAGQVGAGAVQIVYGSAAGLTNSGIQNWSRASTGIPGVAELNANFGAALTVGDFDGDGYADLAIGIPRANVDGISYAGAVQILYGHSSGLGVLGNELISQNTPGFVASPAEFNDQFGFALAAGDFNGDGVDDLAVGTPYEDNGVGFADAGSVQIFFGKSGATASNSGLLIFGAVVNPQHWRSDSANVEGLMEENDRFGWSLAVADFDGDGYDDLAVGIPYETHGEGAGALLYGGAINVIMGGADGLAATPANPARIWHQGSPGMVGAVAILDLFGWSLAAADFNNDGYADLAIGVPGDQVFSLKTGAVQLVYGSANGLTATGNSRLGDTDNPEATDFFGGTLFAADFNGNGYVDIAVGAPMDSPTGVAATNVGSVFTFYSDSSGPLQTESQYWYPGFNGLKGTAVANDYFGEALPGSPKR